MALRPAIRLYQHRGNVRTVAPASEPVTAAELRDHLRETATSLPDADADALITSAREMIEENTGLALITQTWRLSRDDWPGGAASPWWDGVRTGTLAEFHRGDLDVILPRYPLQSVSSVTTYADGGASTSVTVASVFDVDSYSKPGRMALRTGATWPTATRAANAIEVVYVSGYGASASDVPSALRRAVMQVAAALYAGRGDGCEVHNPLAAAGALLAQYRVARL